MGLLAVWYCGANRDSTCSSALSTAPVRGASSSVLPPRRRAVSAKLWLSRSVDVVVLMRFSVKTGSQDWRGPEAAGHGICFHCTHVRTRRGARRSLCTLPYFRG